MRRLIIALVILPMLLLPAVGLAQTDDGRIDVVEIRGVIDDAMVDFVTDAVDVALADGAQAVVLRLDSPGAVTDRVDELVAMVAEPLLPVVVWVGQGSAEAWGAAARIAGAAQVVTASPGASVGWADIAMIGDDPDPEYAGTFGGAPIVVDDQDDRFATVQAAPGQIVVWLNGQEIAFAGGTRVLSTAEEVVEDGETRLRATADVRFVGPGLWTRLLQAPLEPITMVFLLSIALAVIAFEFYALGPGLAAATALVPLLIAAYGLAHLPLAWWALALLLLGIFVMVVDYQAGAFGPWSLGGGVLLTIGGRFLVDGAPVLGATWTAALLSAVGVTLFFAVAMPVVARNRFSTGTFGRSHLVGRKGSVVEGFHEGAGVVEVDGARWRATAHRESVLPVGAGITVAAVQGVWLEVDPA